jgi:membrane protease YdiL (CAAX protease family)
MLELGPLGLFLVYLARLSVALFALQQALRLRTPFHRAIAISALLFFLIQIPGGIVFEVTAGVYYWFLVGLVFLAVRLDRQGLRIPAVTPEPLIAARPAAALAPQPAVLRTGG